MNKHIIIGRLTTDPDIRQGKNGTCIARYRVAVDRRRKAEGQPEADFFNVVSLGSRGEFIQKYFRKGMKILCEGEMHNNDYEKDGIKVYGMELVTENVEFVESKETNERYLNASGGAAPAQDDDGFEPIDPATEEELPY